MRHSCSLRIVKRMNGFMAKLSDAEKAQRLWDRTYQTATKVKARTYLTKTVAPLFQKMIRAESAARPDGFEPAVVRGDVVDVPRYVGECVCVTCGKVDRWNSGIKGMHTGHFLAGRSNSILLQEDNVAPQCSRCNYYQSGQQAAFRLWMSHVRGFAVIESLIQLKQMSVTFSHEDLVWLKISYATRLKCAVDLMTRED